MADVKQAVLLAAGVGSRLLPITREIPKCLVPVRGVPLVDHLLTSLAPLDLDELVVVTGWQASSLRAHLGEARGKMRFRYVHSPEFAAANNIVSLHAAAPLVRPPFALLECDVLAEAAVLASLQRPDSMVLSRYAKGMDGTGVRLDAQGRVTEIILRAHQRPLTRYRRLWKTVNLSSFSAATWARLEPELARWVHKGRTQVFYEAVLAQLIAEEAIELRGFDASSFRWQEVDSPADLARAEAVVGSETEPPSPRRATMSVPSAGDGTLAQA